MREIILDIETTGLNKDEDRIIEIGCVEVYNKIPTENVFHTFINPAGVKVSEGAVQIHGITDEKLKDAPKFEEIVPEFLQFIAQANIIAHNASFDIGFINKEFDRLLMPPIEAKRIIDTLAIARKKYPLGPNNLDALCRRFNIDNKKRTLHGALLDAQLLAEVYIELHGGRQKEFDLLNEKKIIEKQEKSIVQYRKIPLKSRITEEDKAKHRAFIDKMIKDALWNNYDET